MRADLSAAVRELDWTEALRIAAKSQYLGEHKTAIQRGNSAMQNPNFYKQMKQDPDLLIDRGIAALKEHLKLI